MSQKQLYQRSLDPSKPEIRLLKLTGDEDSISCKLETVTYSGALQFAALSYVWGDSTQRVNIAVDGVHILVSKTLAAALGHVRKYWHYEFPDRDTASFRIWVDALCINQADPSERREQVKLMRQIYSSADLVLGWLGAEDVEQAFTAVKTISLLGAAFRKLNWDHERLCDLEWLKNCPELIREPECDNRWNSLDYIGTLPYWRRVWILQENVLATTLFYVTPNVMIEYNTLMNVCLMFSRLSGSLVDRRVQKPDFMPVHIWLKFSPPKGTGFLQLTNMVRFGYAKATCLKKNASPSLSKALELGRSLGEYGGLLEATDPKDHIYGLLGLTSLPIEVDYTKDTKHVYIEYCRAVLETLRQTGGRSLVFFRDAGIGVFENVLDLPSWAPNYPTRALGVPTLLFDGDIEISTLAKNVPLPTLSGSILSITGIRLQVLRKLGGPPTITNLQRGGEVAHWIQNYIRNTPSYVTKIPSLWALFLVVMRMQKLEFDTPTLLLLQNFVARISLEVPENTAQRTLPRHYRTHEMDGIAVGITLDGGNQPEMMMYVSNNMRGSQNPAKSLDDKMLDVNGRLIHLLERNSFTRIFETNEGYLGMGPQYCKEGDCICLIDGNEDLVLLRKDGHHYRYVGSCIVYGISALGIKSGLERGDLVTETFELV